MVRRHRLQEEEIEFVMKAVHMRLSELLEEETTSETENLFRVLWRFTYHRRGPPSYPEITREEVEGLLNETMELRIL